MTSYRILVVSRRMGSTFAFLLALAFLGRSALHAQQDQGTWHVLIEPGFMHPPVSFPIPGAKETLFVPGYVPDGGDPVYFTKKDWDAAGVTWDQFRARATQNATEKKVSGQLVRDSKKVVEYAVIHSESPLTATMVLAPDFLKKFRDIFGGKVLVALPDRFTVYVFPELASQYKDYAQMVIGVYRDSAYPVSLEVFEVSADGICAIGKYDE